MIWVRDDAGWTSVAIVEGRGSGGGKWLHGNGGHTGPQLRDPRGRLGLALHCPCDLSSRLLSGPQCPCLLTQTYL